MYLHVLSTLKQETDATGRPSSITRGGKGPVTRRNRTSDTAFFEWMTNNTERKDGSIVFIKRDDNATLKELKFGEAYLVGVAKTSMVRQQPRYRIIYAERQVN